MSAGFPDFYSLMKRYDIKPRKSLGQNFLLEKAVLNQIVQTAGVTTQTDVLEIGAGLGSLTFVLSGVARQVMAIELDTNLIPVLQEALKPCANVVIKQGDILEIDLRDLDLNPGYFVVANIPYYITSAVIRHLLEAPIKPARLVLTVQREVADRICSRPGDLSLLALSVQVYGDAVVTGRIPAGAFYPPPSVDSACVRVNILPEPRIPEELLNTFFRLIKAGFSQKRKTLRNSLSAGLAFPAEKIAVLLKTAEIDPMRRAETLSIPEWERLVKLYDEDQTSKQG